MEQHPTLLTRRRAIVTLALAAAASRTFAFAEMKAELSTELEEIQKKSRGRLGCSVLDTSTGKHTGINMDARFPMCSTSKLPITAFVLHRVDNGAERLDRRIVFSKADLVAYSPITSQHVGPPGMTIAEICKAAITVSDNTAANLLLKSFGGPPALTAYLRSMGDSMTRLDRTEPTLNQGTPGDPRDTTTPAVMLLDLRRFALGNALSPSSRTLLTRWLLGCRTGGTSLRAGMPGDWKVADKTGSGGYGSTNDVAIVWPPHRKPVLVTAYLTECVLPARGRYAILADVGRAVADWIPRSAV